MARYRNSTKRLDNAEDGLFDDETRGYPHRDRGSSGRALVPRPTIEFVPERVASSLALRAISERLAPLAAVESDLRLTVAGCDRGDGVSTVAVALAVDLSQRLSLSTVLIDAHLRRPALHLFFNGSFSSHPQLVLEGALQIRRTGWPRLDLANCSVPDDEINCEEVLRDIEAVASSYQAAVVDLGAPRLDARMLRIARPGDPLLLVVRYGKTLRTDLANTAAALRAAKRTIAGVILNDRPDTVGGPFRRYV